MGHGRGNKNRGQRDAIDVANHLDVELDALLTPEPLVRPLVEPLPLRNVWTEIDDRRVFDFDAVMRPAVDFGGRPVRAARIPASDPSWSRIAFAEPRDAERHAVICARRKERREVWFAKQLHRRRGRGGSRRRKWWSDVKC